MVKDSREHRNVEHTIAFHQARSGRTIRESMTGDRGLAEVIVNLFPSPEGPWPGSGLL